MVTVISKVDRLKLSLVYLIVLIFIVRIYLYGTSYFSYAELYHRSMIVRSLGYIGYFTILTFYVYCIYLSANLFIFRNKFVYEKNGFIYCTWKTICNISEGGILDVDIIKTPPQIAIFRELRNIGSFKTFFAKGDLNKLKEEIENVIAMKGGISSKSTELR